MDKVIHQLYDQYYKDTKQLGMLQAFWQGQANQVSQDFSIHRPIVRISTRTQKGRYRGSTRTIIIGEHCWRGIDKSFYHEIAHHITRERFGMVKSHGRQFKRILWQVVNKYCPNYTWDNEYTSVKHYAEKKFAKLTQ